MTALLAALAAHAVSGAARLPGRVWAVLAGLALLVLAGLWIGHAGFERGSRAAVTTIERANRDAEQRADAAADPVERCHAAHGRWLRDAGACQPALRGAP